MEQQFRFFEKNQLNVGFNFQRTLADGTIQELIHRL